MYHHSWLRQLNAECTEISGTNAWDLNFDDGNINNNTKASNSNRVRAVTELNKKEYL